MPDERDDDSGDESIGAVTLLLDIKSKQLNESKTK
jgi:hypothetical protein